MQKNLKTFVSKFVQEKSVQTFPHLYIVDKHTGPYRKIQQAIDAAEPNSLIKISQGFYQENLVIQKPLRLEPKNLNGQSDKIGVVILASGGNAVHIKLSQFNQQCQIVGMKFSHSGNSDSNLKNQLMEHQHILNIFQHHQNVEQLESQFVNRVTHNKMENIIILIERGKMKINNFKSCNTIIPAIWIEKDGDLNIKNSQIKGNQSKDTIGIVCRLGTLVVENCVINNHKEGGVLVWGIKDNNSKIMKSIIEDNSVGVHMVGEESKFKIISCNIKNNKIGIKVGLASQPEISHNLISQNVEGIQINSAFPVISLNKIEQNKQNGIISRTYKKFICKAIIRKNVGIVGNKLNGILVEGENNKTQIICNYMIGFNGQSGIKIQKNAFPNIISNKIYKNFKEGVLVVEESNAIIEKNQITHNVECNVALGGAHSHQTILVENTISHSPGSGINVLYSGNIKLLRNDVSHNEDGILVIGSRPQIRRNNIFQNKNNGLICQQSSNPNIIENFISRNGSIGLLIRHRSCIKQSVIHSNILASNEIDVGMQEYNQSFNQQLQQSNTIDGKIYFPEGLPCQIM